MKILVLLGAFACLATATALYQQCSGARQVENLEEKVNVSGCKRTYCRLKKKTQVTVEIKFKPTKEIKTLTNTVSAQIAGIPFPFIGTDGSSACGQVYQADGTTKASCPLKADTDYVYKNAINVLELYPRLKVVVHWALTGPDGDVICFEVPARITN